MTNNQKITSLLPITDNQETTALICNDVDDLKKVPQVEGTSTVPEAIFNMVKCIVGAGVLGLPAGIASFGSAPSSVLPATLLISILGIISAYSFYLIGRVCCYTNASTFREAWDKSLGKPTSWIPAATSTAICLFVNTAYSMILADTFKSLLQTAGFEMSRTNTLYMVTILVLLPLTLLKNLSSLAPFSLLGIFGMVYTVNAMFYRYLSGDYSHPNGRFLADVEEKFQPKFGDDGGFSSALTPKALIFVCMLSTAFMAHFNAPKFYVDLKNNTMERFGRVVGTSFFISILFYVGIAAVGFLTFGSSCSGFILNNYSTSDGIMSLSRVAVALSIVFSYPLIFVGARDGILDLMSIPPHKRPNSLVNRTTLGLLLIITTMATYVKDLGFLLSILGATSGVALIYIYPSMMFRSIVKDMGDDGVNFSMRFQANVLSPMLMIMGLMMGAIGARMSFENL